jgi:hypothetical protein
MAGALSGGIERLGLAKTKRTVSTRLPEPRRPMKWRVFLLSGLLTFASLGVGVGGAFAQSSCTTSSYGYKTVLANFGSWSGTSPNYYLYAWVTIRQCNNGGIGWIANSTAGAFVEDDRGYNQNMTSLTFKQYYYDTSQHVFSIVVNNETYYTHTVPWQQPNRFIGAAEPVSAGAGQWRLSGKVSTAKFTMSFTTS